MSLHVFPSPVGDGAGTVDPSLPLCKPYV